MRTIFSIIKRWRVFGLILLLLSTFVFSHSNLLAQQLPIACGFGSSLESEISATANGLFTNYTITLEGGTGCTYHLNDYVGIGGVSSPPNTITILGNGATIIGAEGEDIFNVFAGETLELYNLTLLGGQTAIFNNGTLLLDNVTIQGNFNVGVYNESGTATINYSTITDNGFLGALNYANPGPATMTINDSNISRNGVAGISNTGGDLTILRTAISGNEQGIQSAGGNVDISHSTISYNFTEGLYIDGDGNTLSLINSTISGNSLPVLLFADTGGLTAEFRSVTIAENLNGTYLGALELGSFVNLTLENTVIADNYIATTGHEITVSQSPSISPAPDPATTNIIYENNNFIGSINPLFNVSGATNLVLTGDPMLEYFDGRTYKPDADSPLLDAGVCTEIEDQNYNPRPFDIPGVRDNQTGSCDIGAHEVFIMSLDDSYTAVRDTTLTVAAPGVFANDSRIPGSLILASGTENGTLIVDQEGGFVYTPNKGFVGKDNFRYFERYNAFDTNIAQVEITVIAPVAGNDIYTMSQGETLTVPAPGVLANDKNPASLMAQVSQQPANGDLNMQSDGSFTYTPNANFSGVDRFFYTAFDGSTTSNPAQVTINVVATGETGQTIFNPAPSNLQIGGNLEQAPVVLTFSWDVLTSRAAQDILNEYHNLRITDENETILYEEWLPASQICTGLTCEVTIEEEDLTTGVFPNGYYRWRVQTWANGVFSYVSDERGFEVNLSTPTLISNDIQIDTSSGRPIILFPDNPNALWYQIFIGERVESGLSIRHLAWYKKNANLCANGVCRFYPSSNPVTGNYELWVQTWGPAGFGIGDEIGGWAGPIEFTMDFSPPEPPTPLTVAMANSGRPEFHWRRAAGSTWFQVWTYDNNDPANYYTSIEWVPSLQAGCLESLTCTYTPDFLLSNNATYQWYIQTWGPGGFASQGDVTNAFDRWVPGEPYTVDARTPDMPEAITPTKVVIEPIGLTYTWAHLPDVSWYQFEIDQTDDLPDDVEPVTYNNWYAAEDIGCRDGANICALEIPFLLLPDGAFRWRLRAWNPAIDELAEDQWSEWVAFTVMRQ